MTTRAHDEFLSATLPTLDLVHNLSRHLVRRPHEAEDLVQETFLRAFKAWSEGRRPRRVEPWIATICLNTGRDWIRRATARPEVPSAIDADVPAPVDVEEEAVNAVLRALVHEALWTLPEEQRIAISLMDLGGFTASETARITGSPRGTVLARVQRGRKKLAAMLERSVIPDERP